MEVQSILLVFFSNWPGWFAWWVPPVKPVLLEIYWFLLVGGLLCFWAVRFHCMVLRSHQLKVDGLNLPWKKMFLVCALAALAACPGSIMCCFQVQVCLCVQRAWWWDRLEYDQSSVEAAVLLGWAAYAYFSWGFFSGIMKVWGCTCFGILAWLLYMIWNFCLFF